MGNKKHTKTNCFLCSYEITKHNKSSNHVLYKNKSKPICRYCTKNKHKALENKYKNTDIQCKKCNKPTLYKKCIKCSICNHFYHGKCLDLNREDIDKIEKVCNFFICRSCNIDISPDQTQTTKPIAKTIPKATLNLKTCLTCCSKIPKFAYPNKYLIYNNEKRILCQKCSKLNTNIPVRDKSSIEFQDCSLCKKIVKYESIFCNLCQHLIHPHCNGIGKNELTELSQIENNWYCLNCNITIYPNYLLSDTVTKLTKKQKTEYASEFQTYDDCSVCFKKVTGNGTLSCSTCKHWVHKKCIGHFKDNIEFRAFLQYYYTKEWECPTCLSEKLPFIFTDYSDFILFLLEMNTKPTYLNKENFQKVFASLSEKEFFNTTDDNNNDHKQDQYLNSIDADINFIANDTCNYIINVEEITNTNGELTMMTFNIRSIRKNFSNFEHLVSNFKCKLHIICVTESWLGENDNIEDFQLDGYHTPQFQNRPNNLTGGGVITYIHKDISNHKYMKDLSFADDYNNCLATEITVNNKAITFLNIYRSPNNFNTLFNDKIECILKKLSTRICYILGDMNYNLLNIDRHNETKYYYDLLTGVSFKPLIIKPTRITDQKSTLIDHIWTNDLKNTSLHNSNIVITDITDHLPCVTMVKHPDFYVKGYKTISKRVINDRNRVKFTKRISELKDILNFQANNKSEPSLEAKYNNYFDQISMVYNECFPVITKKVHSKILCKPWITPKIQALIKKKNKLFSMKTKYKTEKNQNKYKKIKQEIQKEIKSEKSKYYNNLLEQTSNNMKQKWTAIRQIVNRSKAQQSNCIVPNSILGEHYSNVAQKLAEKIPKLTKSDIPSSSKTKAVKKTIKNKHQFNFNTITDREVYELLLKLDSKKGPGTDNIDTKSLKSIAHIISVHLASLFNQSIIEGVYPNNQKIAKCIPIYKGSPLDPSDPVNYRPISILTAINKAFERILHNQLSKYLEKYDLLPYFQYGYRRFHNTSQAVADYIDYVKKATSNQLCTIAVFMDLSKAFDTVDKELLEQKLHKIGLTGISTSLINSYMTNRKFCMNNDNKYYNLTHGVPQGSILGPLLFIIYTSDMTKITKHNKTIVYADDTTVLISGRNLTEAKQHCNAILTRFYNYFTLNKLSINPSKTKYMIYKPIYHSHKKKKLNHDTECIKITMDNKPLKQVQSIKFLGIIINDKLTWEDHKRTIHSKISKNLGLLYKCRMYMKDIDCINMYKTFIQPYFLYCIEVWGHTINSEQDILYRLQCRILRLLFNCKRSEDAWRHSDGKISSISNLYSSVIKKLCMKHHFEKLPHYFSKTIMPEFNIDQLQNKITRISLDEMYNYKSHPKDFYSQLKTNCIKHWNSLPLTVKSLPYMSSKDSLFKHLKLKELN